MTSAREQGEPILLRTSWSASDLFSATIISETTAMYQRLNSIRSSPKFRDCFACWAQFRDKFPYPHHYRCPKRRLRNSAFAALHESSASANNVSPIGRYMRSTLDIGGRGVEWRRDLMLDDFVFGVGDLIHQPPLKWRDP